MQLCPDSDDLAASPRLRRPRVALVLKALLTAVLMFSVTACLLPDYADGDFVGTFENDEGGTITLRSDGTGTLTGLYGEDRERPGTWELDTSFILFFYDEPDPEMGSAANAQIFIDSEDELYLKPNGQDSPNRISFERTGDE